MNMPTIRALLLPVLVGVLVSTAQTAPAAETLCGGWSEASVTNAEVIAAAQFAVNAVAIPKHNAGMRLAGILSAQQQVVAGMNYRLRLKVNADGEDREAEAVVWWQAWRKPDPYQLTEWTWKQTDRRQGASPRASRLEGSLSDALKSSQTNGIAELREGYSGELKIVFTWGVAARLKAELRPEPIEFTHLNFGDRGAGNRCERRTSILAGFADEKTGEFKVYGSPSVFISNLPETDLLRTYRTIEQFKAVFGEFRGMTDGWGSTGEMHSSLFWRGFAPAQSNALRVVSVFLHTVGKQQTPKQERTWTIEGICIQEGAFAGTGHKPQMKKYEGVK